jgi:C-terminal processing protease CtpA/Prc
LRRWVSRNNFDPLVTLDFNWELKENSDHYSFFSRGIPILMLHTGLHDDYHRPSDDAHKLNAAGMESVARLLFNVVVDVADQPELPKFRAASRHESPWTQQTAERLVAPLPGRMGVAWNPRDTSEGGFKVSRVVEDSPADIAGIHVNDRILKFGDRELQPGDDLAELVLAATSPTPVTLKRPGAEEPIDVKVALAGQPVKLGITWREDDAEPGSVKIVRVVPGSRAAKAGLAVLDRIHDVDGREFANSQEFQQFVADDTRPLTLGVERRGRMQPLVLPASTVAPPAETTE